MRETRTAQISIFESGLDHQIAFELREMSRWLDEHPHVCELVRRDVSKSRKTVWHGRRGLTGESILRCAILKQYRQSDFRTLEFYLKDSVSFIEFARLDKSAAPSKSTLQSLISGISTATWEQLNRCLLLSAQDEKIEDGTALRVDSTVTDSNILEPCDSGLLRDSVRVMTRMLKHAGKDFGLQRYPNHLRKAKSRAKAILNAHTAEKRHPLYVELLTTTRETIEYLKLARKTLQRRSDALVWCIQADHYLPLIEQVINQTVRRVMHGEKVPASEKIVSLFEPHADIIVKGNRKVQYGHKITLSTGASALVLDVIVEQGNPADSDCLIPIIKRHKKRYGHAPDDLAVDGGYTSQANLDQCQSMGVTNAAFHKRVNLTVEQMTGGDNWLYNKLRRFRAGIEASISYLKRCFGLSRCNWKGLAHFKQYVHSGVFVHNLVQLAYLRPG